jgi:hypothetical protein
MFRSCKQAVGENYYVPLDALENRVLAPSKPVHLSSALDLAGSSPHSGLFRFIIFSKINSQHDAAQPD